MKVGFNPSYGRQKGMEYVDCRQVVYLFDKGTREFVREDTVPAFSKEIGKSQSHVWHYIKKRRPMGGYFVSRTRELMDGVDTRLI